MTLFILSLTKRDPSRATITKIQLKSIYHLEFITYIFELVFSFVLFCLSKKGRKKDIPGQGLRLTYRVSIILYHSDCARENN